MMGMNSTTTGMLLRTALKTITTTSIRATAKARFCFVNWMTMVAASSSRPVRVSPSPSTSSASTAISAGLANPDSRWRKSSLSSPSGPMTGKKWKKISSAAITESAVSSIDSASVAKTASATTMRRRAGAYARSGSAER